jgi:hypothetical protein
MDLWLLLSEDDPDPVRIDADRAAGRLLLEVDDVVPLRVEKAPTGSRAVDPPLIGGFLVSLSQSVSGLTARPTGSGMFGVCCWARAHVWAGVERADCWAGGEGQSSDGDDPGGPDV